MKKLNFLSAILVGFTCFFTCSSVYASPPGAVYKNNQALEMLKKENHYAAYKGFLKALESDPLNPAIQYNLGVAFLANEEFEKAMKRFELADRLGKTDQIKYMARFAAGIAATQLKQIPRALENYQKALEIMPDSEEVKKNIELLWQGGGQGQGEGQDQQQDDKEQEGKDGEKEGKDRDQEKDQGQPKENKKPKPKEFKSKELTPDQVRKILEELKAQEQKIRAEEFGKDAKDAPKGKDW